ncbi:MAG TPA: hypothetical protein VML55_08725 [Planctomycetaceae bacterium]|nr:hypothetical protein [Planctomycetaceae bacterium]
MHLADHTTHDSRLAIHPSLDSATTFCPSDPRVPLDCDPRSPIFNPPAIPFATSWSPPLPVFARHPDDLADEFLCDGGDRALPVHYDRYNRLGLDTEDAIAEYVDDQGRWYVRPTNVVCIYAPRFGQVRSLSGTSEGVQVEKLAAALDRRTGIALGQRTVTVMSTQPEALGSIHVRSRASGLETENVPEGVHLPLAANAFDLPQTAFENITFFLTGRLVETEEPFLAMTVQAALAWTRDEFPAVMASTAAGEELLVSFTGAEIVGIDDRKAPGDLRIVKAADRATAVPGDVVTFTLRYDNLGDRELYEVRIVDNLTPRLAYVADSATSDRPGDIHVEDNGEGSSVLTFELDDPLPGRTGGTITFQTRVR